MKLEAACTDLDVLGHVQNMHDTEGAVCRGRSACQVLQRELVEEKLH